jgi:hypothetical protein
MEKPLRVIAFCIQVMQEFDFYGFEALKPLLVRRSDGGVVTIADVVEQLSRYPSPTRTVYSRQ